MVIYVADTSAVFRFLDNEAGADRIEEVLVDATHGKARVLISAIHWGEVAGVLHRRVGITGMSEKLDFLLTLGFELVPASSQQAVQAHLLKNDLKIPYADAFGAALAMEIPNAVLITADFDFKPAVHLVSIEFLPQKPVKP